MSLKESRDAPGAEAVLLGAPAAARGEVGHDHAVGWPRVVRRPSDLSAIPLWDAAELSCAIRGRVVSCVEVMTAHLDHIERVNPAVNAIVSLRPRAELLAEAEEKDRLLRRSGPQGWMHGFPHAVKDLADVRGLPTSLGLIQPDPGRSVASQDSTFVARLREAGAIFIGKTNTPQLGLGSQTYNDVFGATGNAYDPSKTSGGSSGGAAVAVALRMVPVADGSDFMGSLRNPPGWNNVFGLRPSFGRVPSTGHEVFIDQGGVNGPIARTALDLALLLQTMSGYTPAAPLSIEQDPRSLTDLAPRSMDGRKVAWLGDLGGYLPMEPEVLTVTREALRHFERIGMTVTNVDGLPVTAAWKGNADLWPTWLSFRHLLSGAAVRSIHDVPALRPALKAEAMFEMNGLVGTATTPALSAVDVVDASMKRTALYDAVQSLFQEYDYLVLPTAQLMPFSVDTHWPAEVAGVPMSSYHRWMEVTTIGTLLGAPTLAVPAGFGASGLPIGLQVIGRNHDDVSLMSLAAAWERETGWVQDRLPALLER